MSEMRAQVEREYKQHAEDYIAKQIAEREAAWKVQFDEEIQKRTQIPAQSFQEPVPNSGMNHEMQSPINSR